MAEHIFIFCFSCSQYNKLKSILTEFFWNMKSIMTIHNLKFQGIWDIKTVKDFTGLPAYYFTPDKLESYKDANLLKGGIVYADYVTTVSDTYAEEIKTPFCTIKRILIIDKIK